MRLRRKKKTTHLDNKKLAETHLDTKKKKELKVAGCHVLLETMYGIKVAGLINSARTRLYD